MSILRYAASLIVFYALLAPARAAEPIRVLVVTGGHAYEIEPFRALFRGQDDIQPIFKDHPDAGRLYAKERADAFDVLVLYDMPRELPAEQLENLVKLLESGKGVVALHHTLAALPNWSEYHRILGGKFAFKPFVADGVEHRASTFHHDQTIPVTVIDAASPITAGVTDFTIHDETYNYFVVDRHVHPLLTTRHPKSGKTIAWMHRYANSPVVYIQLGHDSKAYVNPAYRRLVANAIRWAASPQALAQVADADGFKPIFNGVDLTGWKGDPKLWLVKDGMLVGKSPGIGYNDFLTTTATYGDFELQLDFNLRDGQGNSGVQFRSHQGTDHVIGYQADIGQDYWGCLYDEARRRRVLVPAAPALAGVLKKDGWNHYVVRAEGDHITLEINGVTTVDYHEPDAKIARSGILALQIHSGPAMEIRFKDIRLKELGR